MIDISMIPMTNEPMEGEVLMCRTMPDRQVPVDRYTWGDD